MRLVGNPPNRFEAVQRDRLEAPSRVEVQLFEDDTKQILSRNDSPDLPFRWSVNPYRGCFHACSYCYARPSHEYWGFGAGTDFESKIVLKRRAAELLRQAFDKPSWAGRPRSLFGKHRLLPTRRGHAGFDEGMFGGLRGISKSRMHYHEGSASCSRPGSPQAIAERCMDLCLL